jgi:hypothetical protein
MEIINFILFYLIIQSNWALNEELDSPAVSALDKLSWKLSNVGQSSDG